MILKFLSKCLVLVMLFGASFSLAAQNVQDITIGETVNGSLDSASTNAHYRFSAVDGDVLLISLTSPDFDTVLAVENAAGVQVDSDDDGGQRTNSLISPFLVPITGDYTIVVAGYGSDSTGDYVLRLDRIELENLTYGQSVSASLPEEMPGAAYAVDMAAGDLVVAYLFAQDSTSLSMELLDPEGALTGSISFVDAETVRIGPVEIFNPGQYILNIVAENDYEVMIDRIQPVNLTLGQAAPVALTPSMHEMYFTLAAQTGQVLDFTVTSESTQALDLELLDPALFSVGRVDNLGGRLEINSVYVPIAGLYYVVVSRAARDQADAEIAFQITAQNADLPELDEAPVNLHFDSATSERILTFSGTAGERVRLMVEIDEIGDFGSPSIEMLQAGTALKDIDLTGISRIVVDYELPENGQVVLRFLSFADATFEVSLERSPESEG